MLVNPNYPNFPSGFIASQVYVPPPSEEVKTLLIPPFLIPVPEILFLFSLISPENFVATNLLPGGRSSARVGR